ncbi:branched-chain amino acid ABC transporter ATP-binding protein/permease [Ruixingdingia sedimenti]|uniref:Branched-chain amino acid ABC transporter ATP-binding protein/permease n=1 Tax=Ruixingdingia sedimenti TaxID=3073604 RepID=A0ABU1FD60_9RHOB|nr:branched-chain amino acid ABC transporter ATP-binding protein/permease [Xinfangfangia sp. LG-4]MDR5654805.1 branched-chain amino acid ABC transporter ATP-binding protein/permease [Xinfangfangia sp. LG-4]
MAHDLHANSAAGGAWKRNAAICVVAAALLAVPALLGSFAVSLFNLVGIYAITTLGLTLLTGSGGVTSFAQAAFMGVGAYTSTYFSLRLGLDPWLGLLAALALTGLCAAIMGAVTLHLGGHYLPITTLAWAVALFMVFGNLTAVGGHSGIGDIPPITVFGFALDRPHKAFYLVWGVLILTLFGAANLLSSRQGRAISALRGGAALAESLGINAFRLRLVLFLLAAELACVAGWMFAHTQSFISPTSFDLNQGMQILLMSVLGGVGNILGALAGAAAVTFGKNAIQDLVPMLGLNAGTFEIVIFGIAFILIIHKAPKGLSPVLGRFLPAAPRPPLGKGGADGLHFTRTAAPGGTEVLLQVKNLQKRYGGLVAVDDVSFEVRPATIHAIIGPNGAGKSTTFDLISGMQAPTSGTVHFNGRQITGTPARGLIARGLSRTFQHVRIRPNHSLLENVMMGAHWRMRTGFAAGILRLDRKEERAFAGIAHAALRDVGLDADPHAKAGNLALGPQRLLEIARALASDPRMVILDEPAAGLRAQEKQALAALLRRMREAGVTILLIEHDMDFVMGLADRIVVLEFGRLLATGTPDEIRSNERVQAAYLGEDV